MNALFQDLRYALRQLRKSPGFTLTAVTVLALGLGANIAVFTVLNGILLRPLPYAKPDRIVKVELAGNEPYYAKSYANMAQLRDAFGGNLKIAMTNYGEMASVVGPNGRLQVERSGVTANLFDMLGVQPTLGRTFRDEENEEGHSRVVVLSEEVWRKLYGGDPQIIGKTLIIKRQAHTIIGVAPRGFSFPIGSTMQVWSPMPLTAANRTAMSGEAMIFGEYYARLPEGVTSAQLAANLSRVQAEVASQAPNDERATRVEVTSYQQSINKDLRKPVMLLYGVVFGIWALACLNVTSLMLARTITRSREQAVRVALGAGRMRLLQQTIVESLLLSGIGAGLGMLLGQSAIKLLWRQFSRHLNGLGNAIQLDWRVIACLSGLTLITAAVVGMFPAFRVMRRDVQNSLHGVTTTASATQSRTRESLVVAQLAITLVFLVGAGLFLRTIHALRSVSLGFAEQNVLTGGIVLNGNSSFSDEYKGTREANVVTSAYLPLLDRLRAIPGVRVAALSSVLPMRAEFAVTIAGTLDHQESPRGQHPDTYGRLASAGLVEALGIPMVRGRFFTEEDTLSSPVAVVVNQAFVNRFLPGQDPIGHTYGMAKSGRFAEAHIVGVIGDVKQSDVTETTKPEVYFCLAQIDPQVGLYGVASAFIQVAIRGAIPADSLRAQFDKALHEVVPDATTTDVKTIHEAVEDSFGSQTLITHLLESFAILALMTASVGLYGLLSFAVAQRTREIGLRIALGAPQGNILSLVLRRAMFLVGIGLAVGGTLAWFTVKFASSYIYGVEAHDGLTFTIVVVVLSAAALVAAWLPARRAASVDPILALRSE